MTRPRRRRSSTLEHQSGSRTSRRDRGDDPSDEEGHGGYIHDNMEDLDVEVTGVRADLDELYATKTEMKEMIETMVGGYRQSSERHRGPCTSPPTTTI
eukprot:4994196-Pyramimonas_sp.AAC.1